MANGKPEKVFIKKIFPSNLEGQEQFFQLLQEHQGNYGGKLKKKKNKTRKYKRRNQKRKKTKRRSNK